jgi:hypothetical protein
MVDGRTAQASVRTEGTRVAGLHLAVVLLRGGMSVNDARLALVNDLELTDEQSLVALEAALRRAEG